MYIASIIVAVNNEYALSENFLSHILSVTEDNIEIVIVVDGIIDYESHRYFMATAQENRRVIVIVLPRNQGYSIANNIGAKRARGEYLIFLNSDTFPIHDGISLLIEKMRSNEKIGAVQGMILYPQTNMVQSCGHIFSFYRTAHLFDGLSVTNKIVHESTDRQALSSCFMITRRRLFDLHDGFDEIYYNAWEGLEFTLKIQLSGLRCVFFPDSQAFHIKGAGRNRFFRDEYYQYGYFWHKWGDKITIDIGEVWQKQIADDTLQSFRVWINASGLQNSIWQRMMVDMKVDPPQASYEVLLPNSGTNISIESSIPMSIIEMNAPVLFLTRHFSDVLNNWRFFKYRDAVRDCIFDLSGNVICPQEYYQMRGSR